MLLTFRPGDDVVCFVDERGNPHTALVTHWFGKSLTSACNLIYLDQSVRDARGLKPIQLDNIRAFDGLNRTRTSYWRPYGVNETTTADGVGPLPQAGASL